MNIFQDALRRIAERVDGARVVSLVGLDGIPIDSYGSIDGLSAESVAVEMGAFVRSAQSPGSGVGPAAVQQLSLVTDRYVSILSRVTEEYYLLLLLAQDGNIGRGRFELRKAAAALEKELL
jgi:predicted regulator of Ras-like GTPase activity (Roadblock/LC7/MglB family)